MGKIKENIKLAIANGMMDKGLVLDFILNLISDAQLEQAPEFRLLGGFAPTTPVDGPSPQAIEVSIEDKIKELIPDAVFTGDTDTNLIPKECGRGKWHQLRFIDNFKNSLIFFTKDLKAWKSTVLHNLMNSDGYRYIYRIPCMNGDWKNLHAIWTRPFP